MSSKNCSIGLSEGFQKYCMDQYVRKARNKGLRSRSWFKIQSIDYSDKLFYKGMKVVDLGSSPGGWSSYVIEKIGKTGNIVACDLLPMNKIPGVDFLKGDCSSSDVLKKLCFWAKNRKANIVLSDMSPKTTGISVIDVSKSICLGDIALNICLNVLGSGGSFLVKVFQGDGFDHYVYNIRALFNIVKIRKPVSSRSDSREVYIVAKDLMYK